MTQFVFSVYYPFEPFPKVIIMLLLYSLLTTTTPSFPTAILTAYTTSFGVLFIRSSRRFTTYTTISRAYRAGTTLATTIIRVFPAVGAFIFVWPAVISAHVGFVVAYLARASRMASFTCPIITGVSLSVVVVARPSSSYRLASTSSRTIRIS